MKELPITVKRSIELVGLVMLAYVIAIGKDIIMPIVMAFFISIVLLPLYQFFKRRKLPEALAIFLSILILIVIFALIGWFFSSQVTNLLADFPTIRRNVTIHLNSLSGWIDSISHFSTDEQIKFIDEQSNKLLNYATGLLTNAANSVSAVLLFVGLLPIYVYLLLFYKNLLLRFVFMWFPEENHAKVKEAMLETKVIIKSYLIGLLIQVTYMTVLLGTILLIIGIKHALLIAVIFAFLNLIPYIGALIGNLIGVLLTLTSSDQLWPIFAVLGTIAFVQFLDNNILMPRIVGSKVKINALGTIVGVFVGGSLAGISGMFLSLPIIAVLKITFDRSNVLRHWGVLLGDEIPKENPITHPEVRSDSEEVRNKLEKDNGIEPTKKGKDV
ncbi:AI-2E family transporter [Pedobacter sp. SYSU D00535]|uniref:AI-2E family transporter n=1 Tax=Pedobacter sp. SYSU D00535 TaxID=2810308 RepID=UPI001A9723D6|nr:AI-2E family transporter [Pedobacter sp. SYSU D00535]